MLAGLFSHGLDGRLALCRTGEEANHQPLDRNTSDLTVP